MLRKTRFRYPERMTVGPVRMTLAIVLIAAGVLGFVVFLVTSLMKTFGGMHRVEVPGTREMTLEPGSYTVYWESDSRFTPVPSRSDLDLSIASKGGSLAVSSSGLMASRYSTMDRVGASVAAFTVEKADLYAVKVAPAAGLVLPKGGVAVGRSIGFLGVLKIVLVCVAILGVGLGGGLTLLLRKPSAPGP
jgi:hypothetical protein